MSGTSTVLLVADTATVIPGTRRTHDGYLVADVRTARAGNIQVYRGAEVGKPEMETVRVYRPEETVFDKAAMASFAYKPVTVLHPKDLVTADNWRDHAVGITGGEIARDGEFLRMPMCLMDADAIAVVEDGTRELSCGYTCDLAWEPGETPGGEKYDAKVVRIMGNHLAVVPKGRAGSECRIGDRAAGAAPGGHTSILSTARGSSAMADDTRTVMVDGLTISTTPQGAEVITRLQRQLADAAAATEAANTRIRDAEAAHTAAIQAKDGQIAALQASHTEALAAKDGEIAALQASHKQAIEAKDGEIAALQAKLSDEALDARVAARTTLVAQAKRILGDAFDPSGKSDAEIRKLAVTKALGATLADIDSRPAAFFDAAFEVVAASAPSTKPAPAARPDPLAAGIAAGAGIPTADAARQDPYQRHLARLRDAWKNPNGAEA